MSKKGLILLSANQSLDPRFFDRHSLEFRSIPFVQHYWNERALLSTKAR